MVKVEIFRNGKHTYKPHCRSVDVTSGNTRNAIAIRITTLQRYECQISWINIECLLSESERKDGGGITWHGESTLVVEGCARNLLMYGDGVVNGKDSKSCP